MGMNIRVELAKEDLISQMKHNQTKKDYFDEKINRLQKRFPNIHWPKLKQDLKLIKDNKTLLTKVLLKVISEGHNKIYISNDPISKEFRKAVYSKKKGMFFRKVGIR